jgi:hypothetical protein
MFRLPVLAGDELNVAGTPRSLLNNALSGVGQ